MKVNYKSAMVMLRIFTNNIGIIHWKESNKQLARRS